ncbi:hypothetical protein [Acinetobacter sp. CFCC 10889]|uniref:hypothetical protein n=1 Tax=Acinetobacter sp. CFCC 10889 TaxID=1775557 RepID=UPI000DCFCBD2|nr:hypothetical protein [Acinetobacter sp. CFCC 10889]
MWIASFIFAIALLFINHQTNQYFKCAHSLPYALCSFLINGLLVTIFIYFLIQHNANYYERALNSPQQVKQCGHFIQQHSQERSPSSRGSSYPMISYEFQNDHQEKFIFSDSILLCKNNPLIAQLQPKQKVCFSYSPRFTDDDNHPLLTQLENNESH